jgi:CDP-glycerol glycerophosphotransferase
MLNEIKQCVKIFLVQFIHLILHIGWIFPVRNKQICFSAYTNRYACNPKYIYEYLKNNCNFGLLYVWIGDDVNNIGDPNTLFVPYKSLKHIFYLLTSKILITNTHFPVLIPYRKQQILINTWHGGGAYKKIGLLDIEKETNRYKIFVTKKISYQITFFISSCQRFTDIISDVMSIDPIKCLHYGMPRNDLFFSGSLDKNIIKNNIGIDVSASIILYAPTYRGSYQDNNFSITDADINISGVIDAAKKRFNKKFIFLYRSHHAMKKVELNEDLCINVTTYPDMQELLYIADILITDYSSSVWDFSFTYKPCFLYTPDLENYKAVTNFYTPIEMWPFPLAQSNTELKENIIKFDEEKYHENVKKHHKDLGSFENGTAREAILKKIRDYIK